MANGNNSKILNLTDNGTVLHLTAAGDYTIDVTGGGKVQIKLDGGHSTLLSQADFNKVTTLNLADGANISVTSDYLASHNITGSGVLNVTGVGFTTADVAADHKFEPTVNLDTVIQSTLAAHNNDVSYLLSHFSVNGNTADTIKVVWDYIDDHYSYYNTTINSEGVQLGIAYANYLRNGGAPILDTVKYTPDGPDAGTAPDRVQSLHDNLLGNLDINSIVDKFFDGNTANNPVGTTYAGSNGGSNGVADEVTGTQLINEVYAAHLDGRPYNGGYEGQDAAAAAAHQWDVAQFGLLV